MDECNEKVVLLSICDFQSRLVPFIPPLSLGTGVMDTVGGLARIATAIKEQRAVYGSGLAAVVLGTDPTGPMYTFLGGRAEYSTLMKAGFDVLVPGEHEVELGREHFSDSLQYVHTPLLCANLKPKGGRKDIWQPNRVLDLEVGKVGLFGLTAPPISDSFIEGACLDTIGEITSIAEQQVAHLRQCGCRVIIALTHIGLEGDKNLARSVAGLDAVLGAHSHTPTDEPIWIRASDGGWVPVVQSQGGGASLGRLEIAVDRPRTDRKRVGWSQIFMNDLVESDLDMKILVDEFQGKLKAIMDQPIAKLPHPLPADPHMLAVGRASLGYLIADGIRHAGSSDVGLVAAADIVSGVGLAAGMVSRSDLYRLMPFGNTVWEMTLSGENLKVLMLDSFAAGDISTQDDSRQEDLFAPCFLYFAGIKVERKKEVRIWIDTEGQWRPVELERTYRVAVPFLLRCGGRGCRILCKAPGRNLGIQEVEAVTALLQAGYHMKNQEETHGQMAR